MHSTKGAHLKLLENTFQWFIEWKELDAITTDALGYRVLNIKDRNFMDDIRAALNNLAPAAVSKTDAIDYSMAANKHLMKRVTNLTKKNKKLLNIKSSPSQQSKQWYQGKPVSYCWTHGFVFGLNHNRQTCHNKAQGPTDKATKDNTMGRSLANKSQTK